MDLEQIYALHFNDLYRYLYSLSKNHAEAEDLLQETFAKAHIALLTNDIKEIKPWLFKVGYFTYIDHFRKDKRYVMTNEFSISDLNSPENIVVENDAYNELLRYLDYIRPIEKQAILLCDVHDWSNEQAANILNIKLNTLKSHLSRGRKRLREMLSQEES
ncbi:sigma-70 family RNA polymerase sigma factor [Psychrobacillus sp. NEAU-3TGS]|uniref:sigma-70 family RNA polymerase sigma factor n=1 Tax=Psychrobacillus sp. NEAU-3TGS TaxID=2995412 RepID=UPI00249983F5|nr:sigma-70 family RNA polymerase sigma factor [Psychrobacillus sp. NEAU-3TGS]MDI2586191.1 sigma-70 family RNA polymerase sigma factor [Psychrobacillus sp. NEAU-3TGS]